MKIYVAHTKDFDFHDELYAPIRASELNKQHEFILPHEGSGNTLSRDIIKGCDLFVAEISHPSTSLGIEIGWADAFGVPVIAMRKPGANEPWWHQDICKVSFEYEDAEDMVEKLTRNID